MNIRYILKFVLIFLPIANFTVFADEPEYYAVMLDGQKVGHCVMTRIVINDRVYSGQELSLELSRLGMPIAMQTTETLIETLDAKPLGFETKMVTNGSASGSRATIDENGKMELYVYAGTLGQTQIMDYPKGALLAEGTLNFQKQRGLKPGDKYTLNCYVPSSLAEATVEVETFDSEQIDLFGRIVTATKQTITNTIKGQTISQTDYIGDNFKPLKSIVDFAGLKIELIACDKLIALSENDIYDMLDKMLVDCPISLPPRNTLKSATYQLTPTGDTIPQIPSDDNQTATVTENQLILKVDPLTDITKTPLKYTGTNPEALAALESSQFIQSDNELIIKLAQQAIGDTDDASVAIYKIEKFVGNYISEKNLSVGYASAVEVAQSKEGDCTEHAVLTAALCRAVGIPARIAVGLVYVDSINQRKNVMGGHAWTEAYIGNHWIGLDATRGYGPGHIKLDTGNGQPSDFLEITGSLGSFKISNIKLESKP